MPRALSLDLQDILASEQEPEVAGEVTISFSHREIKSLLNAYSAIAAVTANDPLLPRIYLAYARSTSIHQHNELAKKIAAAVSTAWPTIEVKLVDRGIDDPGQSIHERPPVDSPANA